VKIATCLALPPRSRKKRVREQDAAREPTQVWAVHKVLGLDVFGDSSAGALRCRTQRQL